MKKIKFKNRILALGIMLSPMAAYSQATQASESGGGLNLILFIIAFILLIPIYLASKNLQMTAKRYSIWKNNNKTLMLILTSTLSVSAFAGDGKVAHIDSSWVTWFLFFVIIIELLALIYLYKQTIVFLKNKAYVHSGANNQVVEEERTLWDKLNSFKPLSEEGNIDTGHSYDGIRELDNITPPWFVYSFIFTIVFAVIYMYRYHVAKSAPLMEEEYQIELANAEKEKIEAAKIAINSGEQKAQFDENNIAELLTGADAETGATLFTANCVACHGTKGESKPGPAGVGPNLLDKYWLHGGSNSEVFKSIKYGWPEKGMVAWKSQLSDKQIYQIASYILSMRNSNPAGGKEPQGDEYIEQVVATVKDSTTNTGK